MAGDAVYRPNVDYTVATQTTINGKVAFTPDFNAVVNVAIANIASPLGTNAIADSVAVTPATSASWAVTGPITSAEYLADNRAATGTKSAVASGVASVTILASNAVRKGAMITNTDANVLYLDLSGGTATSTSFSVAIAANGFYELPNGPLYTGLITGIWAADGSGSALVTEFT